MSTAQLGTFETRLAARPEQGGIDLRASATDGTFEGFLCRFNVRDSYGTTFKPGAFIEGGLDERLYALLWMHDPTEVGGSFSAREKGNEGLWIEGAYDDTTLGNDLRQRAKSGSAAELSNGFVWLGSDGDDENLITSAKLVEGSQITARMASVPGSQISAVRSWLPSAKLDVSDDDDLRAAQRIAAARARLLTMEF